MNENTAKIPYKKVTKNAQDNSSDKPPKPLAELIFLISKIIIGVL